MARAPRPGDVIGGRYLLGDELGHGGMATVHGATHVVTRRPCAVKLIHPQFLRKEGAIELFTKEVQIGHVIGTSPHVVDVLDAGFDDALGAPFLAMDLLVGESLDRMVSRGPLDPALVSVLATQLAEAMDQAHAARVIHRDLKPSNLFLTRDFRGRPVLKVLDFGIAKVVELGMQATATALGTPAYAAPEQLGATWRQVAAKSGVEIAVGVSPATDVWAVGLIVYELLTGAGPGQFWGVASVVELPTKVVLELAPTASSRAAELGRTLPAAFDAWLACCLARDARERFPTVGAAVRALLPILQSDAVSDAFGATAPASFALAATPVDTTKPPARAPRARGRIVVAGGAIALALATAAAVAIGFRPDSRPAADGGAAGGADASASGPASSPPPVVPALPPAPLDVGLRVVVPTAVRNGRDFQVQVATDQPVFVAILHVGSDGKTTLLVPDTPGAAARLTPTVKLSFPPPGQRLTAQLPRGVTRAEEHFHVLAAPRRDDLARILGELDRARLEPSLVALGERERAAFVAARADYAITR